MLERIKKRQSRMCDGECQEGAGAWLHEACDHHTQFSFVKKGMMLRWTFIWSVELAMHIYITIH